MRIATAMSTAVLLVLAGCSSEVEPIEPDAPTPTASTAVEVPETEIALGEPFTINGPNYTAAITFERVYIPSACGDQPHENPAIVAEVEVTSGDGTHDILNAGMIRERTPDGYIHNEPTISSSCDGIDELDTTNAQTGDKFRGVIWLRADVDPKSEILIKTPAAEGPVAEVFVLDLSEIDVVSVPAPPSSTYANPVVDSEPYVVECLIGTPGPSRMSDGTIVHTDYCFQELGGPSYLEQERQSGLIDTGQQHSHDGVPVAEGGTCPAYLCGYGHDEQGNPYPSSGEVQTQHGCEQGYITDVELCAAVGRPVQ